MISRIRLEAFGHSAAAVEQDLHAYADKLDQLNVNGNTPHDLLRGEQVIERDTGEGDGTRHAFKGRMILHPNVAEPIAPQPDSGPQPAAGAAVSITSAPVIAA